MTLVYKPTLSDIKLTPNFMLSELCYGYRNHLHQINNDQRENLRRVAANILEPIYNYFLKKPRIHCGLAISVHSEYYPKGQIITISGENNLFKWIKDNLNYHTLAQHKTNHGKMVEVSFISMETNENRILDRPDVIWLWTRENI